MKLRKLTTKEMDDIAHYVWMWKYFDTKVKNKDYRWDAERQSFEKVKADCGNMALSILFDASQRKNQPLL